MSDDRNAAAGSSSEELAFPGLQQLICAALADAHLAERLLDDPASAVEHLPSGIALTDQERALVSKIRGVSTLSAFAAYLYALMQDAAIDSPGDIH